MVISLKAGQIKMTQFKGVNTFLKQEFQIENMKEILLDLSNYATKAD